MPDITNTSNNNQQVSFSKQIEKAIKDGRITPTFKPNSFVGNVAAKIGPHNFLVEGGDRGSLVIGADFEAAPGFPVEDAWGLIRGTTDSNYMSFSLFVDLSGAALSDNFGGMVIQNLNDSLASQLGLKLQTNDDHTDPQVSLRGDYNNTGADNMPVFLESNITNDAATGQAKVAIIATSAAASTALIEFDCSDGIYEFSNVQGFADDTAAGAGGLTEGMIYRETTSGNNYLAIKV